MGINYIISVIELKQIHKDLERIANALEARNLIDIPLDQESEELNEQDMPR